MQLHDVHSSEQVLWRGGMTFDEIEKTYAGIVYGYEEPAEMWMAGESAALLLEKMGKPLLDAHGEPIDKKKGYYLSKSTGLVPM